MHNTTMEKSFLHTYILSTNTSLIKIQYNICKFKCLLYLHRISYFILQSDAITTETCATCGEILNDGQPTVRLRKKGSDTENATSNTRGDGIIPVTGQTVHRDCRRDYIHKRNSVQQKLSTSTFSPIKALRSTESSNYRNTCILCTQTAKLNSKKKKKKRGGGGKMFFM